VLGVSDSIFLGGNPPFQPTANLTNGSIDSIGGSTGNLVPLTVTTQSKAFKNPEAWNWNFTVERQTWLNSVLSVAYVGRRGLHMQREADINQPTTATVAQYLDANGNLTVNLDSLRPYKGYNSIRETDNVASSMYHSLQVSWNRRFAKGLSAGLAYTFAKSSDNGSNQRDIIPDTYNANNLWGPSEFDRRHVFIANFLYELPFFRAQNHLFGKIVGGWQVSGIFSAATGTPCSIAGGSTNDYAKVGQDGNWGCGNNGQLWFVNGDPSILGQMAHNGSTDPNLWFQVRNPDGSLIFTPPPVNTFNTTQNVRDLVYGPGFNVWNFGLFKKFAINERTGFQFRAEAYNAFNHPNWSNPSFNPNNLSTFGKITSKTGDVRNLQLSLRFYF
jgi:hypothetical protein